MRRTDRVIAAMRHPSPRVERAALLLAGLVMLASLIWILASGRIDLTDLRWLPLAVAAVIGVPAALATNAAEFWASAWTVRAPVSHRSALRTTILATAANMLPIPGGPAVRVHALQRAGVALGLGTQVTLAIGLSWVGVGGLVAGFGASLAGVAAPLVALAGGTGVAVLVGAGTLLVRVAAPGRAGRALGLFLVIETTSVLVAAARLYLILIALGTEAGPAAALVLAVAGILATVVGLVPAGLGVREGLSAFLATVVAVPAATGFAVSLVDRVIGLMVAGPVAFAVARLGDRHLASS